MDQPRSSQRYQSETPDDEPALLKQILELVRRYPHFGYRRIGRMIQAAGWKVNLKRIYRLWRREGLKVPPETEEKACIGYKRECLPSPSTGKEKPCVVLGFYF
ncbi:IS3 family transposase [Gimesia sp.]|uniref:IS3 family transposase n=1 Tax=Gimesia sp. TaxID=2024833 RepID=UPI003A8FB22A